VPFTAALWDKSKTNRQELDTAVASAEPGRGLACWGRPAPLASWGVPSIISDNSSERCSVPLLTFSGSFPVLLHPSQCERIKTIERLADSSEWQNDAVLFSPLITLLFCRVPQPLLSLEPTFSWICFVPTILILRCDGQLRNLHLTGLFKTGFPPICIALFFIYLECHPADPSTALHRCPSSLLV